MVSTPSAADDVHVFSVSELNRTVRDVLDTAFGPVWVAGELSNLARPASGHMYFSLKDADAQVRCAMFRGRNRLLELTPEAGMMVRARARVGLYERRGDYQLIVEQLEPWGAGALAQAFERLKRRLDAEGLFSAERKRALPTMPARIGVITSATGAAVRDVLRVLRHRFPAVPVIVYPVPVQGEHAAGAIARMIEHAGERGDCDVLLLVRGGGALEDLWAFNEEAVARAIAASPIPLVSGIGHEVDVTIADFAADQRAPTPSAAAEAVVPEADSLERKLGQLERRLVTAMNGRMARARAEATRSERRLLRQHPERRLQQLAQRADELSRRLASGARRSMGRRRERLDALAQRHLRANPLARMERLAERTRRGEYRLHRAMADRLQRGDERVANAARALEAVNPLAVLGRGYALVRRSRDGYAVTEAAAAPSGEALDIRLAQGRLQATVERSLPPEDDG
jgi:exodeoxyribonuclease VII large subunit